MPLALSICIATYRRANFIGETLEAILRQMTPAVELIIVDGASPDETSEVVNGYVSRYSHIRYFRESSNSGVDRDYDKAVGYAQGKYCWLMTDDDIIKDGAVARVLAAIEAGYELIIGNVEDKTANLSTTLIPRRLRHAEDRAYTAATSENFFADTAFHISFIGSVIIRRDLWQARDRASYFGTLFVHVGVIFQNPTIENVLVIAQPLLSIRLGNAMWSPRAFEIWMLKWPELVWSFPHFADAAKQAVCRREPWRSPLRLLYYRALGVYSPAEFQQFLSSRLDGIGRIIAQLIARFPPKVANSLGVLYCSLPGLRSPVGLYELMRHPSSSRASRWIAVLFRSSIQP